MDPPTDTIQIQNVVGSTAIGQELELKRVAVDLPRADYAPERSPGIIYRTEAPAATSLIFRSGKIVTAGAQSEDALHASLAQVVDALRELGITVPETPDVTVQNIVSNADLGQPLHLNAIAIGLGLENLEYEPEQFPGLVYRLDDPQVVLLLFGSGKLIITGAQTRNDIDQALDTVTKRLTELGMLE
ncbi:TATA-box-binding protein [Halalkalicoccus ordinarius]|uniref:TATA-box-binding protein n=1 Tax=Halalkalicoccus ordinarius TaxID=3116651 RepID=UPI00300F721E